MKSNEALSRFDKLLEDLVMRLNKYTQLPNAKQTYIKKQEELIEELIEIRNSFEEIGNIEVWRFANKQMEILKAKDPAINEFLIELKCESVTKRQAHIPIQISV